MHIHKHFNASLETSMASELQDEFDFYRANQADFVKKYEGQVVVIKSGRLLGVYPDEATAVRETQKTEKLGTFLVQLVTPGDAAYTQTYHSRVAFG